MVKQQDVIVIVVVVEVVQVIIVRTVLLTDAVATVIALKITDYSICSNNSICSISRRSSHSNSRPCDGAIVTLSWA